MFNSFFSKDKNLQNRENIRQLESILLKLQNIFKYHITPIAWATENVENLFPKITKSNENVLRYNLLCSLAYEKRSFANTLQQMQPAADNFELKLKQLKQECNEFLDICYKYLEADTSSILMETGYKCICDFTITIANEIYPKGDMYVNLLQQKTISEAHKSALLGFLRKFVFSNLVPESRALKYFSNICKVIMERGLPFSLLPNILLYYNSQYERYGKIFDQILKDMDKLDTNVIGIVVSSTLFLEYLDVMSKSTNRNFTYLKKIELHFTRILSTQSLVSVLRFAIDAGFTEEMNLPFLHYLIHLCVNLPANSKVFLLNYMLDNVNYNKFQGDTYVIELANFLGNNKRKRNTTASGRPSKMSSSTRSVTDLASTLESALDLSEDN
ncbi:hypothetical protein AMK59_5749 [Oryctes borbonicus]|uniref:Uncharacterized protein n=1 Tax=Oryctes borbonicus TaxID=1629725 RepID=A0A0T6B1T9_9SCAR|nr:hypothetical protein AMK59_5749 [Oryctes borbonicus]